MSMSRRSESDQDALLPVGIGTLVWAVVLVVLLIQRDALSAEGRQWWLGAGVIGLVSGLGGLAFLAWRKRRHRRGASEGR